MIGRFTLACLDMAGTTVRDDGAVEAAFTTALAAVGVRRGSRLTRRPRSSCARRWAGPRRMCSPRCSSPTRRGEATAAFAAAYEAIVAAGDVSEIPGALGVLRDLRSAGVKVCLTTGFAPTTRDALLDALGWRAEIDLALSPADVGRGRPAPDLILGAMARLGVRRPRRGGGGRRHGQRPRGGARRRCRGGDRRPERRPRRGHPGRRLPDGRHRRRDEPDRCPRPRLTRDRLDRLTRYSRQKLKRVLLLARTRPGIHPGQGPEPHG